MERAIVVDVQHLNMHCVALCISSIPDAAYKVAVDVVVAFKKRISAPKT